MTGLPTKVRNLRDRTRASALAITLLFGLLAGQASAGQLIALDADQGEAQPLHLMGYIAKPTSAGPHPAIVVLHSCGGFSNHPLAWADALARIGDVALAIDSFQPRGFVERCTVGFQDQALDAWRARECSPTEYPIRIFASRPSVSRSGSAGEARSRPRPPGRNPALPQ